MHACTCSKLAPQPRLAVLMVLSGSLSGALAILGVECSTFVFMNQGRSKRTELNPWGGPAVDSVHEANQSTSRTRFFLLWCRLHSFFRGSYSGL